jgi:hypothetical protein
MGGRTISRRRCCLAGSLCSAAPGVRSTRSATSESWGEPGKGKYPEGGSVEVSGALVEFHIDKVVDDLAVPGRHFLSGGLGEDVADHGVHYCLRGARSSGQQVP